MNRLLITYGNGTRTIRTALIPGPCAISPLRRGGRSTACQPTGAHQADSKTGIQNRGPAFRARISPGIAYTCRRDFARPGAKFVARSGDGRRNGSPRGAWEGGIAADRFRYRFPG